MGYDVCVLCGESTKDRKGTLFGANTAICPRCAASICDAVEEYRFEERVKAALSAPENGEKKVPVAGRCSIAENPRLGEAYNTLALHINSRERLSSGELYRALEERFPGREAEMGGLCDVLYDRYCDTRGTAAMQQLLGLIREGPAERLLDAYCPHWREQKEKANKKPTPEECLALPLDSVEWSVRTYNCLKRAGITRIGQLTQLTLQQVQDIPHVKQKTVDEILEKLMALDLTLAEP